VEAKTIYNNVMQFVRYEKCEGVNSEQIIEAFIHWRNDLKQRNKHIIKHALFMNLSGDFAEVIFTTQEGINNLATRHDPQNELAQALMSLIENNSLHSTSVTILKDKLDLKTECSCIEFGTFKPNSAVNFTENQLLDVSSKVEESYLAHQKESVEHFIGIIDGQTYAEVAFVKTLGAARMICYNYVNVPICNEMLALLDANTFSLDFWLLLA